MERSSKIPIKAPRVKTRSRRFVRLLVVPTRKICVPRQHYRTNHLTNELIATTIVMALTIDLSLIKAVVVAGDTKEVGDIKDKEVYADTTMDMVDVDLVVETTKVPLVTKVDPTTKATIMVAKITMAIMEIMATTANIITVVLLVTMVIISTSAPTNIQTRGPTKVTLTQMETKVIPTSVLEEMISTILI